MITLHPNPLPPSQPSRPPGRHTNSLHAAVLEAPSPFSRLESSPSRGRAVIVRVRVSMPAAARPPTSHNCAQRTPTLSGHSMTSSWAETISAAVRGLLFISNLVLNWHPFRFFFPLQGQEVVSVPVCRQSDNGKCMIRRACLISSTIREPEPSSPGRGAGFCTAQVRPENNTGALSMASFSVECRGNLLRLGADVWPAGIVTWTRSGRGGMPIRHAHEFRPMSWHKTKP